jgi:hypothetical protein
LEDTTGYLSLSKESLLTSWKGNKDCPHNHIREINYHTRIERLKPELSLRYDWTNRAAFETIDTTRDLALNSRNIQSFLRINGHYATEAEIVAIIRRLDVDAD